MLYDDVCSPFLPVTDPEEAKGDRLNVPNKWNIHDSTATDVSGVDVDHFDLGCTFLIIKGCFSNFSKPSPWHLFSPPRQLCMQRLAYSLSLRLTGA